MKCKQCGMLIDSSQKNCPNCGVIVDNVDINNINEHIKARFMFNCSSHFILMAVVLPFIIYFLIFGRFVKEMQTSKKIVLQ